jgi:hypothetical protein
MVSSKSGTSSKRDHVRGIKVWRKYPEKASAFHAGAIVQRKTHVHSMRSSTDIPAEKFYISRVERIKTLSTGPCANAEQRFGDRTEALENAVARRTAML